MTIVLRASVIISALLTALSVQAADTAAPAPGFQMHPDQGRFHRKHVEEAGLRCGTCHGTFSQDILLVRPTAGVSTPVNRQACLPCHQAPAKSTLYPCAGRPGKALCALDPVPADVPAATWTK